MNYYITMFISPSKSVSNEMPPSICRVRNLPLMVVIFPLTIGTVTGLLVESSSPLGL